MCQPFRRIYMTLRSNRPSTALGIRTSFNARVSLKPAVVRALIVTAYDAHVLSFNSPLSELFDTVSVVVFNGTVSASGQSAVST